MFIDSKTAGELAITNAAYAICAAIRTAPKACGIDHIDAAVVTGEDKDALADEMRRLGASNGDVIFTRDAGNVDASFAVVIVGARYETRGLGARCRLCRFADCEACSEANAACVFTSLDLGIAIGSAVALLADMRLDNRIMFTIGKAAASLGLLGEYSMVMGIPIAVAGKSPFYDRK